LPKFSNYSKIHKVAYMLENFLNIKNSARALTDVQFEAILPQIARELSLIDYNYQHSYSDLKKDWKKLVNFESTNNFINSTSRAGLKWCEAYMPHFWDVETKGKSFSQLWKNPIILEKVLRWNRKSHSTPYLSELRRGIYFCVGLTKVTMYRPQMAKMIVDHYKAKYVLDPCAGCGGRMLGAIAGKSRYEGFEPCEKTFINLKNMEKDIFSITGNKAIIYNDGIENIKNYIPSQNQFDLIISSPPYYDLEVYSDEKTQSTWGYNSYEEWRDKWYFQAIKNLYNNYLKKGGAFCWNIADFNKKPFVLDTHKFMESLGAQYDTEFFMQNSKRPASKVGGKSQDTTFCWIKA